MGGGQKWCFGRQGTVALHRRGAHSMKQPWLTNKRIFQVAIIVSWVRSEDEVGGSPSPSSLSADTIVGAAIYSGSLRSLLGSRTTLSCWLASESGSSSLLFSNVIELAQRSATII